MISEILRCRAAYYDQHSFFVPPAKANKESAEGRRVQKDKTEGEPSDPSLKSQRVDWRGLGDPKRRVSVSSSLMTLKRHTQCKLS